MRFGWLFMTDCQRCRHYYITWDRNFPYGCRAMAFKSRQMPCIAVRMTSGKECLSFEPRKEKAPDSGTRAGTCEFV
ncbi:MAG: uracil-DNA glycosylase [Deltaproteobacteria bacterium]|nr:uracil-DNA glycosylase [Deltaproteobacteria bacterium]